MTPNELPASDSAPESMLVDAGGSKFTPHRRKNFTLIGSFLVVGLAGVGMAVLLWISIQFGVSFDNLGDWGDWAKGLTGVCALAGMLWAAFVWCRDMLASGANMQGARWRSSERWRAIARALRMSKRDSSSTQFEHHIGSPEVATAKSPTIDDGAIDVIQTLMDKRDGLLFYVCDVARSNYRSEVFTVMAAHSSNLRLSRLQVLYGDSERFGSLRKLPPATALNNRYELYCATRIRPVGPGATVARRICRYCPALGRQLHALRSRLLLVRAGAGRQVPHASRGLRKTVGQFAPRSRGTGNRSV